MTEDEVVDFLRELSARNSSTSPCGRERPSSPPIPTLANASTAVGEGSASGTRCRLHLRDLSEADPDGILLGEGSQTRFLRIAEPNAALRERIAAYVQQAIAQRLLDRGR